MTSNYFIINTPKFNIYIIKKLLKNIFLINSSLNSLFSIFTFSLNKKTEKTDFNF